MSMSFTVRALPLRSKQCGRALVQTQVRSFSQKDTEERVAELRSSSFAASEWPHGLHVMGHGLHPKRFASLHKAMA